ncbi:MAG: serine/threonine protein kinase, partial [Planctomycetota bacterium]
MSRPKTKLPIAALEQIDDLCAEFERHWQKNERPDIDAFLKDDLPRDQREVLLTELIALDLDYRRRLGES